MISKLTLINFRKFKELNLELNSKIIIFTGANATGKTSVLEAIYLTATSKSHRTNEISSLILNNEDFSRIELKEEKNFKVVLSKEGKTNYINNLKYSKLSDFIGKLKVVLFSPLDIELITGSKQVRRNFLDLQISLYNQAYLREIMIYRKLLKERNEILKNYQDKNQIVLKVVTEQLIAKIEKLYLFRKDYLNQINLRLKTICRELNCENIELSYQASYDENNINQSFENKLNYDLISKTTNIGLHRDDFLIKINGLIAKNYASEGQARMIALAIKLADKELYVNKNQECILLLDDVFASFDQKRINALMKYIKNEHQTFITTTSLFNIPNELLKDAKIIRL